MYVCICNAVCERRVMDAISAGHEHPDAVYAACGVTPNCRMCADTIEEMVADHKLRLGVPAAAE